MRHKVAKSRPDKAAVGSGGVIDPKTNTVTQAKPIIPDHVGSRFDAASLGVPTVALNDGLATAWGHACLPEYAGQRVATLALGTGVGFGLVDRGRMLMGPGGEPPHLNDVPFDAGRSVEEVLGGAHLANREEACAAAKKAVEIIQQMLHPDAIVLCGGVGLADWLDLELPRSPFGEDAGLYGAAALAVFPPEP